MYTHSLKVFAIMALRSSCSSNEDFFLVKAEVPVLEILSSGAK
jgi:hypothetical protein